MPLALLNQVDAARLTWLVPGMIREKVTWYLKGLPKALRNRLVPLPDAVTAFLEAVPFGRGALPDAMRDYVEARAWARRRPPTTWDGASTCRAHLVCNVRVVDAAGKELAAGRDLAALRAQLGEAAQALVRAGGPGARRRGLKSWDFGDLPETLTSDAQGGQRITGYPALVDDGDSVSIALLDTRGGGRRIDSRRRDAAHPHRLEGRAGALRRRGQARWRARVCAGRAAVARRVDPDRPAAGAMCSPRSAIARSSATTRCRAPSAPSPSR